MSGGCGTGCGSDWGRRDQILAAITVIGILVGGTGGALYGYIAGYGLAVLAVLAAATIVLYLHNPDDRMWWIPGWYFVNIALVQAVDVALGSPLAGGGL